MRVGIIGAGATADRVVDAAVRPVLRVMNLELSVDERGGALDHLGHDALGPADDEHDGEEADGEAERGQHCALAVPAEIAPADP